MKFIWWKLKMSYHTAYPGWDCPVVVCHLFLYSFICAPTTAIDLLSKFCTLQLFNGFIYLGTSPWCRVSFLKGDLQFTKLFKNKICTGVCTLKCTEKRFIPFTPYIFSLNVSPIQNLKEALNIFPGMYCIICLSEIMRLSAFKSPLFYPSS